MNDRKPITSHPQRDIVPAVGSPRWSAMLEEGRAYWSRIHAAPCLYCGGPIGECCWVVLWPNGNCAHLDCQDRSIETENAKASNPWLCERAAKLAGTSIADFMALPRYERMHWIRKIETSESCLTARE